MGLIEKRKFILMIGDDGAILVFINGDKVERRLFAKSASSGDRREFNAILLRFPEVPISITVDIMEQSYTKQTLPGVGSLAIDKLVKKRLDRDFGASDIKGAILLGRGAEGRRDWNYLFVSSPLTSNLSDWIDYVLNLDNQVTGIYMLPVEIESLVKSINKKLLKPKEEPKDWQFVVTSNKTGGYRQVILYKNKVIFTRLIRPGKDSIIDIVAGNIEQEVLNTIDYIRRLGFSDDSEIAIFAVLPSEIKKSMRDTKINGNDIALYTPHELADLLGFKGVTTEEDKFSDVVLAANFAKTTPVLRLYTPKVKSINRIVMIDKVVKSVTFFLVTIFILYSLYLIYELRSVNSEIKQLENEKVSIEKKWKNAQKNEDYSIDEANKITNVYTLYEIINEDRGHPLDLIEKIMIPNTGYAITKSFTWSYVKANSNNSSSAKKIENAEFSVEFKKVGSSIEGLFNSFEQFNESIKAVSEGYDVEISELPSTITFDDTKKSIPIKIKLKTISSNY